ncbi:hypothetical protein K491DRAFT_693453 [Lophiostoma macrostomum CBS 122681]|uniref:Uncharacterized protein n=1 Tax=Lophiostoma macrostomum CBS 122681 TaxID=1314788 RepID=A0A6A6T4T3_9PLEO|nr:hypothetical protein K491DRAFT_693453 [Lophiostoma macrostomum CBS 122681]
MFRCQMTRQCLRQASPLVRPTCPITARLLSTSSPRYAQKDSQDKDSLKPRSTEYSKSGSDDAVADSDEAFNPSKTRPEQEKSGSESESGGQSNDPLDVSPGNPEVSKPRGDQEGGASNSPKSGGGSGGGSAPKSGGSKAG